jgi:hypothetical protein
LCLLPHTVKPDGVTPGQPGSYQVLVTCHKPRKGSGEEVFMNQPGIAAVLSFLIPGLGQIYNGDFLRAIFWFIVAGAVWFLSAGLLGWVCHLAAAYTAYRRGKMHSEGKLEHR